MNFFNEYALGLDGMSEKGCDVRSFDVADLVHAPK